MYLSLSCLPTAAARSFWVEKEVYGEIDNLTLKGTTTIGVVTRDGVILASDTRVTMGSFVAHKKGKKIYKIDDHLAMTVSGNVADAQQTVEILKANSRLYRLENKRPMPIKSAARLVSNFFFSARFAPFIAQILASVSFPSTEQFWQT